MDIKTACQSSLAVFMCYLKAFKNGLDLCKVGKTYSKDDRSIFLDFVRMRIILSFRHPSKT